MVVNSVHGIHRSTTWASVGKSAKDEEATSHVGVAGPAG